MIALKIIYLINLKIISSRNIFILSYRSNVLSCKVVIHFVAWHLMLGWSFENFYIMLMIAMG